jgi:hypothetical protein
LGIGCGFAACGAGNWVRFVVLWGYGIGFGRGRLAAEGFGEDGLGEAVGAFGRGLDALFDFVG